MYAYVNVLIYLYFSAMADNLLKEPLVIDYTLDKQIKDEEITPFTVELTSKKVINVYYFDKTNQVYATIYDNRVDKKTRVTLDYDELCAAFESFPRIREYRDSKVRPCFYV